MLDFSVLDHVEGDSLSDKIKNLSKLVKDLKKAVFAFGEDIKIVSTRWNCRLSSNKANRFCDEILIVSSCGCCSDAIVDVYPYIKKEGYSMFSDPVSYSIGYGYNNGIFAYKGWENKMRENNIPESIIEKVKVYLDNNLPDEEDEDE